MISRLLPFTKQTWAVRNCFATVTLDQIDYYKVLQIQSGATSQQIHQAYSKLALHQDPAKNPERFHILNEAFVILTNSRSRDAYDSLLKTKNITYLNDVQQFKVTQKSYIAQRREDANRIIRKKMNIDEFGRYKGGLPKMAALSESSNRGRAANTPGTFNTRHQIETYADSYPEYNIVDSQIAESFKNYHQKDRRDRTMKQPWFNLAVDYDYFTFKTFRTKYLIWIKLWLIFGISIPIFFNLYEKYTRKQVQLQNRQKAKTG